jgi:hypothetical protein
MKNKAAYIIIVYISLFMLISLSGCFFTNSGNIKILTDDPLIFEAADDFNAQSKNIKASVEYFNVRNEDESRKNVFKYFEDNKFLNNYDLAAGNFNPEILSNIKIFYDVKIGNKNKIFGSAKDFIDKHEERIVPYSISFPVIAAAKESIAEDLVNKDEISLYEFARFAKNNKWKDIDSQTSKINIFFTPLASSLKELDYLFITGGSIFFRKKEKIFLSENSAMISFGFYFNFDEYYNFGKDAAKKYLERYNNIEREYYLKQKIISADIIPVNEILKYPDDVYKIFFISGLKTLSLYTKAAAIPKSSIKKESALIFLEYLLSEKIQKKLFYSSLNDSDFVNNINMPVLKKVLEKSAFKKMDIDKIEKYSDNLKYPEFYSWKFEKKFFQKYFMLKDYLSKGTIDEKDFVKKLAEELNR